MIKKEKKKGMCRAPAREETRPDFMLLGIAEKENIHKAITSYVRMLEECSVEHSMFFVGEVVEMMLGDKEFGNELLGKAMASTARMIQEKRGGKPANILVLGQLSDEGECDGLMRLNDKLGRKSGIACSAITFSKSLVD